MPQSQIEWADQKSRLVHRLLQIHGRREIGLAKPSQVNPSLSGAAL
jgi:hypothetical protein